MTTTAMILFAIAAWGWFCLVMISDEGDAPISAFIFLPVVMPLVIGLATTAFAASVMAEIIKQICKDIADFERGL
jgi:hypothetical protein